MIAGTGVCGSVFLVPTHSGLSTGLSRAGRVESPGGCSFRVGTGVGSKGLCKSLVPEVDAITRSVMAQQDNIQGAK
ncbi:hypothetical protein RRG08_022354 [Elysia crispata]|uniref:Uncharacterized protein n=1 Tax=Elysia crispata TaxID=231223 RepID=A0AAE0Z2I5_9GAST|nr:hypothetical protein RRG08_022354 [Elysia crispata]